MGAGKNKIWSSWENKGLSRHLDGSERREHCIPETKPQPRAAAPGTPQGADRSIFLNSILPARPRCAQLCSPVGMAKGRPLMLVENMFCIRARLSRRAQSPELTRALQAAENSGF